MEMMSFVPKAPHSEEKKIKSIIKMKIFQNK